MPDKSICAALLLVLCACHHERPAAAQTPAAPPPKPVAIAAAPAVDPHAERYATVQKQIDKWGGDHADLDAARNGAMEILAANRDYAPAYVALARIEYREGYINGWQYEPANLERASKLVNHALKLDPDNREAHITAANIAAYSGNFDIARDHLDAAERVPADDGAVVLGRMTLEQVQRHPDEAIRIARAGASKIKPDEVAAYQDKLATCYQWLRMTDDAEGAYRAALVASPKSAWLHSNYAGFLVARKRFEEAIPIAEQAVAIMPFGMGFRNLFTAYGGRLSELWHDRRYDEASRIVEKIERIGHDNADAQYEVGTYYELVAMRQPDGGFLDRAEAAFKRALVLEPDHEGAKHELALIAGRRGRG
jgi:tetratricopeptide (TPR) repeat protein